MSSFGLQINILSRLEGLSSGSWLALLAAVTCLTLAPHASGQVAEPVRVGGEVKPPRKIKDANPTYPAAAREAKKQGTVILEIVISAEGKVASIKVVRSLPPLDQAAVEAVQQWRYAPTLISGKPTAVVMTVALNFAL